MRLRFVDIHQNPFIWHYRVNSHDKIQSRKVFFKRPSSCKHIGKTLLSVIIPNPRLGFVRTTTCGLSWQFVNSLLRSRRGGLERRKSDSLWIKLCSSHVAVRGGLKRCRSSLWSSRKGIGMSRTKKPSNSFIYSPSHTGESVETK